jgi:hypothetical protein
VSRRQDAGYPNNYKSALEAWDHYRSTCVRKQGQYNDFMSERIKEWATKHTCPGTDTSQWLKTARTVAVPTSEHEVVHRYPVPCGRYPKVDKRQHLCADLL